MVGLRLCELGALLLLGCEFTSIELSCLVIYCFIIVNIEDGGILLVIEEDAKPHPHHVVSSYYIQL